MDIPPDDDDYKVPDGWDLDGSFEQGEGYSLSDMAVEYHWDTWRDIIAADGTYDEQDVRPGVYFSADDALSEAYNVGILDFTRIVYDDEEEVWFLVVDGDSGGGGN